MQGVRFARRQCASLLLHAASSPQPAAAAPSSHAAIQQLLVRGFGSTAGSSGGAQAALPGKHRWLAALAACLAGTAAVGVAAQTGDPGGLAAAECKGAEQGNVK